MYLHVNSRPLCLPVPERPGGGVPPWGVRDGTQPDGRLIAPVGDVRVCPWGFDWSAVVCCVRGDLGACCVGCGGVFVGGGCWWCGGCWCAGCGDVWRVVGVLGGGGGGCSSRGGGGVLVGVLRGGVVLDWLVFGVGCGVGCVCLPVVGALIVLCWCVFRVVC